MRSFSKETKDYKIKVIPTKNVIAYVKNKNGNFVEFLKLGYIMGSKTCLSSTCFYGNWNDILIQNEAQNIAFKAFEEMNTHVDSFSNLVVSMKKLNFNID